MLIQWSLIVLGFGKCGILLERNPANNECRLYILLWFAFYLKNSGFRLSMPALDEQLLKDKKCLKDSIRLLKVSLKIILCISLKVLSFEIFTEKTLIQKSRNNWPVLKHDIG